MKQIASFWTSSAPRIDLPGKPHMLEMLKTKCVTKKATVSSTNLWESFPAAAAVWSLVPLSDICIPNAESRSACFFRQEVQIAIHVIATIRHRRECIFTNCCKVWSIISPESCGCGVPKKSNFSELAHRTRNPFRLLKKRCFRRLLMPLPIRITQKVQRLLGQLLSHISRNVRPPLPPPFWPSLDPALHRVSDE